MNDNPFESPSDGTSIRWFRPWRVALVVGVFIALVVGPITWQTLREHRARDRAKKNLEQLRLAMEQYQQRLPNESAEASPESE